ncbi:MAG: hypothetical protein JSU68_10735 [Phycisphaerales bacterium]|nr:MAG: hypothetical protein JSU68_10735 [Phycisphaerales bacterium]
MMWWLAAYWLSLPYQLDLWLRRFWEWTGAGVSFLPWSSGTELTTRMQMIHETIVVGVLGLPGLLLGLRAYHRLTFKHYRDEHTRCGTCGHILKGLTEPRCPECGQPM